jgi:hypothetical protein
MAKRKFNVTRLYRLFRFLVIAISILSGILAFLNYRTLTHADKEAGRLIQEREILSRGEKSDMRDLLLLAKEREGRLTDSEKKEIEQYRKREALEREIDTYISISIRMGNQFVVFLSIAIGLPIIFFGGVGIYRYLFPVLKEG